AENDHRDSRRGQYTTTDVQRRAQGSVVRKHPFVGLEVVLLVRRRRFTNSTRTSVVELALQAEAQDRRYAATDESSNTGARNDESSRPETTAFFRVSFNNR